MKIQTVKIMTPAIRLVPDKKFIGKRIRMSLASNRTFELWQSFMRRRNEFTTTLSQDLYSIQVYDKLFDFKNFSPDTTFEKWAAVEVPDHATIPDGMESFTMTGGLYAVFNYKGDPRDFAPAFEMIFKQWLPDSEYVTDDRPHFELLGEKYKNNDPESEEDIYIPIKRKV